MLDVNPFQQSTGMCGPASLKIVLGFYGLEKTEDELAKLTDAHPHHGTKAKDLMRGAEELGFEASLHDESTFDDLQKWLNAGTPPIVNWFSHDDGHYSVVVGLDEKNVYLQDPEIGRVHEICRETFWRVWFDFNGNYIKSGEDVFIRRAIVIKKKM